MLYLILALSSGIIGGLIVAVIPQVKGRIQKYIVLIFTVFGAYFTWRVAALVFSGESVRLSIEGSKTIKTGFAGGFENSSVLATEILA